MIVTKTPYRVSLFGGCTDYEEWYKEHGGYILGGAIDKYCHVTCKRIDTPQIFDHKYRIAYSVIENCNHYKEIDHPVIKACIEYTNMDYGIELLHSGDLPAKTGIGSSSSFTISVLSCLYNLLNQKYTKESIIQDAINIERKVLKEPGGIQDQILAGEGGLNFIKIDKNGTYKITKYNDMIEPLQSRLILFYTGAQRNGMDVIKTFYNQVCDNSHILGIQDIAIAAKKVIDNKDDIKQLGYLLNESWNQKRSLSSSISSSEINDKYELAISEGALGGKIIGGGGSGFLLLYVEPEHRARLIESMKPWKPVRFQFVEDGPKVMEI